MKTKAILYTSKTGFTAAYAKLLGESTGLPVYALGAERDLPKGAAILYLGWLMAGRIQGYKQAAERYTVCAAIGVGMGATGSQIEDMRKANGLPTDLPLFSLQGGFDLAKLRGVYKWMMIVMKNTVGKKLAGKPDKTPEEADMLDMLQNGGNRVSAAALEPVLAWFAKEEATPRA